MAFITHRFGLFWNTFVPLKHLSLVLAPAVSVVLHYSPADDNNTIWPDASSAERFLDGMESEIKLAHERQIRCNSGQRHGFSIGSLLFTWSQTMLR